MIEIKVLQAYRGDCIWVRCLEESENINIIIDSGTATFKNEFKNLVEEIENNKERINLLVFSHIDNDHIKGCIKYVKEKVKRLLITYGLMEVAVMYIRIYRNIRLIMYSN